MLKGAGERCFGEGEGGRERREEGKITQEDTGGERDAKAEEDQFPFTTFFSGLCMCVVEAYVKHGCWRCLLEMLDACFVSRVTIEPPSFSPTP